jgi:hypothetical protein
MENSLEIIKESRSSYLSIHSVPSSAFSGCGHTSEVPLQNTAFLQSSG